jgi:hypothetical protein
MIRGWSEDSHSPRRHWCSILKPDDKHGSRVRVQFCDDVAMSDEEFAFIPPWASDQHEWKDDMATKRKKRTGDLPVLHPDAAGIDVGASELFIAVPADRDPEPVRSYLTFTKDLQELAGWLQSCGIRSVAMESTSVYWIPVYQILEARGIEVFLVNANYLKNVPGRKSDVSDCQWIQYLHSVGLLRTSFRPPGEICEIRSLWRHRGSLIEMAAEHVLPHTESAGSNEPTNPPRVE